MALNLVGLVAGDKGQAWFDKFNNALTAIAQGSTARDASDAQLQSQITALSNRLNTVSASVYSPPPGAYAASAVGGPQLYSAKPSLYTTGGTLVNRLLVSTTAYPSQSYADYGDEWTATSDFTIDAEPYTPSGGSTVAALVFRRYSRTAAGVVTLNSSVNIATNSSSSNGLYLVAATVQSPTQVIVEYYNTNLGVLTSVTVSWDGSASLSVTTLARTVTTYITPQLGSNYKRGCLVGSASTLRYGNFGTTSTSGVLSDRAMAVASYTPGNVVAPAAAGGQISQDYVGGGYVVRFGASTVPSDNVARPTVWLELWDDNGCQVLQKLRIAGKTLATVVSCVVLNGIAIVQWLDSSSTRYTAIVAFNLQTNALSLFGPYTAGNLGSQSFGFPILFDGLDCYFLRLVSGTTGVCKLMLATFNPGGAVGSELTSVTGNDLALTIALSTASGISALAGVTAISIVNVWVGAADVVNVLYYATSSTSGVSGLYLDTFTLA